MSSLPANTTVNAPQSQTAREELQAAARKIREEVQREIDQARQDRAQNPPAAPTPPTLPGRGAVVIQTDGQEHVIGMPGSEFPWSPRNNDIPPQAVEMTMGFLFALVAIVIGLPIARAFARRMDRKSAGPQIPPELTAQLGQLNQAVDAIALEVERISEGQRFTTRLLSEQRDAAQHALPTGSDR